MALKSTVRKGLGIVLCLLTFAPGRTIAQTKEYQIKAAFLLNFVQFVEWPNAAFANPATPFCIGILGDDPFGPALDETIQGARIADHKLTIMRSRKIDDLEHCQMIFISKSEKGRVAEVLSELGPRPVLTVSEIEGFARRGGIINFYLEGSKVRFEINPSFAKREGLQLSSELLNLGRIIDPERKGDGK